MSEKNSSKSQDKDIPELELSDDDILDAMQHIPGYLDISTSDFRTIYHLAHRHALERSFAEINAGRLMRKPIKPLYTDATLDIAARMLADSGYKGLPVVDNSNRVVGIFTETDFMKRFKVKNFMELVLRKLQDDTFEFTHRCQEVTVNKTMTKPAISIGPEAGYFEIMEAFRKHSGRSMPVVEADGTLLGLLLRKDVIASVIMRNAT